MAAKVEIDILANDQTGGVLGNVASGLGGILQTAAGFVAGQAMMKAGRAVSDFFTSTIQEASDAQTSVAQMNAVLQSTGGAAGLSSTQLQDYASQLQDITAYDDEAIQGAESLMLTFTNVKGDTFKQATGLVLDMSTAMGQDLKTSSIQLGKALNDPIAGIGALSRVGVQFTDDQKKMITEMVNSGDTMGAQQVILDELNKEFGGSAEAFAGTYAGKMEQFNNKMGDIKETVGNALLPVMSQFMDQVVTPLMPMISDLATKFGEWMQKMQDNGTFKKIFDTLEGLGPVIDGVLTAIGNLSDFSIEGTPFGNFISYLQTWGDQYGPGLQDSFSSIFTTISDTLSYVFTAIGDIFTTAMGSITDWLAANGPLIQTAMANIAIAFSWIGTAIKIAVDFAKPIIDGLIRMILDLVTFVLAIIAGDWDAAWQALVKLVQDNIDAALLALEALWTDILALFGTNQTDLKTKWDSFWGGIVTSVSGWATGIANKAGEFFNAGINLIQGFINGILSMIPGVGDAIDGTTKAAKKTIFDRYDMQSPSKLFKKYGSLVMEGFALGIEDGGGFSVDAMKNTIPRINAAATFQTGGMVPATAPNTGGIVINIDARDSLIDERWFSTKFKTGVVQIMRDTGVAFSG